MADENTQTQEEKDKELADLKGQVENLNKGIATYRDSTQAAQLQAKEAMEKATTLTTQMEELKKLVQKENSGVKLSKDEEAKFKAYADAAGLVSKEQLTQKESSDFITKMKEIENSAVGEFLEAHPDYDADDKWKEVMEQFALYKQPTTLTAYRALLNRIYKDLNPDASKDERAKARAEIINREKLRIGGAGGGKTGEDDTEAELDKLAKKYPHLTRDQIADNISATRALLPKNKK